MDSVIFGVLSSLFTEAVVLVNKKLGGTFLQGNGAALVSIAVALAFGGLELLYSSNAFNAAQFGTEAVKVFAYSQGWFTLFGKLAGVSVQE